MFNNGEFLFIFIRTNLLAKRGLSDSGVFMISQKLDLSKMLTPVSCSREF